MKKRILFDCAIELDDIATANWYKTAEEWGCTCSHCRNFLKLARTKHFPAPIIEILNELNIPPEKATYVCELYTDDSGIHYQFSYRIAGSIINEPYNELTLPPKLGRCTHEPYPYGAPDFPAPHFDLEFYPVLPWVLDDQ